MSTYPTAALVAFTAVLIFSCGVLFFARNAWRTSLALIALSLVFGVLSALETAMQFFHDPWKHDSFSQQLMEQDIELGLILRPDTEVRHQSRPITRNYELEWDVKYKSDADRSRHVPGRPDNGPLVALFGGSFMFGSGLNDNETIAAHMQALLPNKQFFNYGVRGHGTAQNYLYLRRVMQQHPDTRTCIVGFITDHVRRTAMPLSLIASDWARYHPKVTSHNGNIKFLGLARDNLDTLDSIHVTLLEHSRLYRRLFSSGWQADSSDWNLVRDLVLGMHDLCEQPEKESRFALVLLPTGPERDKLSMSEHYRRWYTGLRQEGIRVLELNEPFDAMIKASGHNRADYFYSDGHPTEEYARWVAREIVSVLVDASQPATSE